MNGDIRGINEANQLHKRSVAYATNHPGTSATEAKDILLKQDAKNAKVAASQRKAKGK